MEEAAKMRYIIEGIKDKEANKAILYGARSMKELKENLIIYEEQKSRIAESSVRQVRPEDNRKCRQSASVMKYRKCEDLLFRFEEESFNKDNIQKERREQFVINTVNENKMKDIKKLLLKERERIGQLEHVSIKSFETEEEMTRLRNEVSNVTAQETQQIEDLQSRNKNWEGSRNNLDNEVQEKRIMEQCINQKTELQSKLKENQQESVVHKESEKSLRTELEPATKDLEKKNTLTEDMKKQFEHGTNTLKEQLQEAAETIESIKRKIEQLDYKIDHRPGTAMRYVDAFSRNIVEELLVQEGRSGLGDRVCKAQEEDDDFEDDEGQSFFIEVNSRCGIVKKSGVQV
ncbi:CAP-Gly domain-containing linker protein 1-like [Bombus impatiens]|uniref:CAP-Gly domain-containing linker protein 1-like n=1 Tax=Bombus impatiens TaxID=132113 RepID=A0A6P3URG4_BOMIM|nr:CAP-Gly domain-containing linker protein 1-like [Bombus impatiens]